MANETPKRLIKIIWLVHFALSSWAMMSQYLTAPYMFTQMGVLAFGFWAVVATENVDALLMFLVTLCFSVINDIMLISIYQPRADDRFESRQSLYSSGYVNEYRWALGMSIVNLILKPVSIFLVFGIYRSVSSGSEFGAGLPGFGGNGNVYGHSNRPGQGEYNNIESAQDSHPGVYGRSPYPYQTPPQEAPPMQPKANRHTPPPQA